MEKKTNPAVLDRFFKILDVFRQHDDDGSGEIDYAEFTNLYENYLTVAELAPEGQQEEIYKQIDVDGGK